MPAHTRVSAKGQVVIPRPVRDRLRWRPGTELEVVERADGVVLRPVRTPAERLTLAEFHARVPAHDGPPLTLDDMARAVERLFADPASPGR